MYTWFVHLLFDNFFLWLHGLPLSMSFWCWFSSRFFLRCWGFVFDASLFFDVGELLCAPSVTGLIWQRHRTSSQSILNLNFRSNEWSLSETFESLILYSQFRRAVIILNLWQCWPLKWIQWLEQDVLASSMLVGVVTLCCQASTFLEVNGPVDPSSLLIYLICHSSFGALLVFVVKSSILLMISYILLGLSHHAFASKFNFLAFAIYRSCFDWFSALGILRGPSSII